MRRFLSAVLLLCCALAFAAGSARSAQQTALWTGIIPGAFPGIVYTWRLYDDGTYEEDGYDTISGRAAQATLSGRWAMDDRRLILRQTDIAYVFDGTVSGERYSGFLYLNGQRASRFCAFKGTEAPRRCDADIVA